MIFWEIVVYLFYFGVNVVVAWENNQIRMHRIRVGNPKQIEHPLWAAFYCAAVAPMWFVLHDLYFIGSLLMLHISVFPVAYNGFALGWKNKFYLSKTTSAWSDRAMVLLGFTSSVYVNIGALIISLALIIIQLFV